MSAVESSVTGGAAADVLVVRDLGIEFATDDAPVVATDGVSLRVRQGEVLAVVGESGSGKTVTARTVLRLLPESATVSGAVVLAGHDVLEMSPTALRAARGRDAAMVFQEPSAALNPVYTIGWQIAEGLRAHGRVSRKEARGRAIDMLRRVGIPDAETRVDHYPHQFSGGQKQRIIIAMALVLSPRLIIADEPTTALDVTVQAEILDLLRTVRAEFDASVLLITHNMGVVADLADRVVVMNQGKIVEEAGVRELFASPQDEYTKALLAAVPRIGGARLRAVTAVAEAGDAVGPGGAGASAGAPSPVVASGLEIVYPGRLGRPDFHAVKSVSFQIRPGTVYGLVGESGSGKTTIGRAIAGLTTASGGSLRVLGTEVVGAKERAFRPLRSRIGFVFQDPATSFNPLLTIAECIAEPLLVHGKARSVREAQPRVAELLDAVQLPVAFGARYPHELSGGQRQRASLARALALDPELLVADEPTSALDVSVQARVLEVFAALQLRLGFATLFISHDLAVVSMLADEVGVLLQGELVEAGSVEKVLREPEHPYTQRLLASVPVPDPIEQAERREAFRSVG